MIPFPTSDATRATFRQHLGDVARLAVWRTPRYPRAPLSGLATTAIFAALALLGTLTEFIEARGDVGRFSLYGVNATIACFAVAAAVLLAFAHADRTRATARQLTFVFALMAVVSCAETLLYAALGVTSENRPNGPTFLALAALSVATYVWLIGAARRAFKASSRWPTLRGFGYVAATVLALLALPAWPVFIPDTFDRRAANVWEWAEARTQAREAAAHRDENLKAYREAEAKAAWLEAEQHLLLSHAFRQLAPSDPAQANVFTIGVAGWGDQDVFLKEIRQSTDILKARFHLGERTLNLINNAATATDAPMASMANFGEALREVARRMDLDKDLLVLVLSSHGSPEGFALRYDDMVERTLDPVTLRRMLDAAKIKNRVVIVSSCYSGTFVAPLETPDTMVLTAAASDRTSFGCADDRKWTWFGEALFEKALGDHDNLADAFAAAKALIATWEGEQKLTPSHPQMFVGEEIARRFPEIVGRAPAASLGAIAPASVSKAD